MSSHRHVLSHNPQMPSYGTQQQPAPTVYNPHSSNAYMPGLSAPSSQEAFITNAHQRGELRTIGRPVYLASGPLAGRTIRMEVHEIQKADLGRRYGKIDRRPIDPPPVVLLKIFEVRYPGTNRQQEREIEYDTPQTIGLICTVDLFPVLGPEDSSTPQALLHPAVDSSLDAYSPASLPIWSNGGSSSYSTAEPPQNFYAPHHDSGYQMNQGASGPDNAAIHYVEGYAVTEATKQTQALAGNTFVQPIVAEYGGKKAILFVFNDLSVKLEGYFILRYRVFDIYSQEYVSGTSNRSVMAECYGGVFRMYPSKTFPGLPPSTELTKYLATFNGTRVNVRNEERHRRII